MAARILALSFPNRGLADRIHMIALISEIMIVALSGFLALIGFYDPFYLFVISALAYLGARYIGRRHIVVETDDTLIRSLNSEKKSGPNYWSAFTLAFVGSLVAIVLAWNVRNDFVGAKKRWIIGDDAAYHVPIVFNLERHKSLWFPLDDFQVDVPEIGVYGGSHEVRIFFPLNHELLLGIVRFASSQAVEFMRLINYLLMFHLLLIIYCLVKLAGETDMVGWLIALACFLLPVFQGRLLPGQVSVFGTLSNDLFVTLLVLSGVYLAIDHWVDEDADQQGHYLQPKIILLGAIILVSVGTKWYAALYSVIALIIFFIPVTIHRTWRHINVVMLCVSLCCVAIVTNGAVVRNLTYFGSPYAVLDTSYYDFLRPIALVFLRTGSFLEFVPAFWLALANQGAGVNLLFPLLALFQCVRFAIYNRRQSLILLKRSLLPSDIKLLFGILSLSLLSLLPLIPISSGGWSFFRTAVRYAMPAFVLSQCAVLCLHLLGRSSLSHSRNASDLVEPFDGANIRYSGIAGGRVDDRVVPITVCICVAFSLAQYFLVRQVAWLVGTGALVGLLAQVAARRFNWNLHL